MNRVALFIFVITVVFCACGGEKKPQSDAEQSKAATPAPEKTPDPKGPATLKVDPPGSRSLLVTQSQFKVDDKGQYTVPEKAVLLILKPGETRFAEERVEDTESNVFHKALQYGDQGILTLGGNAAKLKLWRREAGKWSSSTLWNPTFGGKHNRLRDFEIADFNGDGSKDLALATHDQGVVAVVWRKGDQWETEELDRKADTFVHEIEIGDLDQDGKLEIYATPSQPNTVSGKDQGGKVVRFSWTGEKFEKSDVLVLETRHMKEILVADVDADGTQELYVAIEAETDGMTIKSPVEIRRYDLVAGKFKESLVTKLDDRFCRFLVAGDIDQDGKTELVAAAFSTGVWVVEHDGATYSKRNIDRASGGFEHAAYIADLAGNGIHKLYVADDRGGVLRRYDFAGGTYTSKVLHRRTVPSQAMVWNITAADL